MSRALKSLDARLARAAEAGKGLSLSADEAMMLFADRLRDAIDAPKPGELGLTQDNRSLQPSRLRKTKDSNPERIYAASWHRRNRRNRAINSGCTLLEHILCPENRPHPPFVSLRDAAVAACVIQWLGTSAGLGFVVDVERRIEDAQRTDAERRSRPSFHEVRFDRKILGPSRRGMKL